MIARTATLQELVERLNRFGEIQTIKHEVNLQLSFLSQDEESIKEFSNVRGFILIQKPDQIRVLAQVPVVRSTAFEMVSDGDTFRVHIPPKDLFLIGEAATEPSEKRLENVRPQHILEALLIKPPGENEFSVLDNEIIGLDAYHVVQVIEKDSNGFPRLSRKFWFDRIELNLDRQEIYSDSGQMVTVVYYREWSGNNGIPVPNLIFIDRRKEEYKLEVRVLSPGINEPIKKEVFVLEPPSGVKVKRIGEIELAADGGNDP